MIDFIFSFLFNYFCTFLGYIIVKILSFLMYYMCSIVSRSVEYYFKFYTWRHSWGEVPLREYDTDSQLTSLQIYLFCLQCVHIYLFMNFKQYSENIFSEFQKIGRFKRFKCFFGIISIMLFVTCFCASTKYSFYYLT